MPRAAPPPSAQPPSATPPAADRVGLAEPGGRAGRTRRRIVEAASRVVAEAGVTGLTLERVAAEAEVSKGGLLYHFGSKRALLTGLLEQTLADADAGLERRTRDGPGAFARAYLDFVRDGGHADGAAAAVLAAAVLDEGDATIARRRFAAWQDRLVASDGIDPTTALLARIVGDGLWLIDLFGLAPPDADDRARVIDLVERLVADAQTS